MLLWLSSRRWKFGIGDVLPGEGLVDLAVRAALRALARRHQALTGEIADLDAQLRPSSSGPARR